MDNTVSNVIIEQQFYCLSLSIVTLFYIITLPGHQSQIIIHYLADEQVRLQYMMVSKDCFLVYENGQFHGSTPRKGNEIFQREETGSGNVALRLVNYVTDEEEGSAGSGAGVEQPSNSTTSTSEEPTNSTEQGDATTEAPTTTTDATTATTEATTATTEATTEASEQTTSTQEPRATVCYLGFPDAESAPRCYDSKENQATHFRII